MGHGLNNVDTRKSSGEIVESSGPENERLRSYKVTQLNCHRHELCHVISDSTRE